MPESYTVREGAELQYGEGDECETMGEADLYKSDQGNWGYVAYRPKDSINSRFENFVIGFASKDDAIEHASKEMYERLMDEAASVAEE